MSYVTNMILCFDLNDGDDAETPPSRLPEVNRFFSPDRHGRGLVSLDDPSLPRGWYGGTKMLEADVFAGAFNYLDLDAFLTHLRSIDWAEPEAVQLFVKEQDDERWRLIDVMDRSPTGATRP